MAQTIGELIYEIKADISGFGAKLKEAESAVKGLGEKMGSQTAAVFKGVAAWDLLKQGVGKATGLMKESIGDALEDLGKMKQARAILESQGLAWKTVGQQVEAFGAKMLKMGMDDETATLQVARFSQRLGGDLKKAFDVTTLAADLAASGYGSFQDNAENLERILVGKGQRALVQYGVAVKNNATVSEQLAAVTKRVTITAEQAANSTTGQFRKIQQAQEELKSALGKGAILAFGQLVTQAGNASGELAGNESVMKKAAQAAYMLSNGLIAVGTAGYFAVQGVTGIIKATGGVISWTEQTLTGFTKNIAKTIPGLKDNQKLIQNLEEQQKKYAGATEYAFGSLDQTAASATETFKTLTDAMSKTAGEGFDALYQKMQEGDDKLGKVNLGTKALTASELDAAEAAEKQAKALEDLQKNLLDTRDKVDELAQSFRDKLTESFNEFKTTLGDTVKESKESLADIVVKAESEIKDLQRELAEEQAKEAEKIDANRIADLRARIAKEQEILTAAAGFEGRLKERLAAQQKQLEELTAKAAIETDPIKKAQLETEIQARQSALASLQQFGDLDKQITEERRKAALDEFSRLEEETFQRIQLNTEEFVSEVTKLREKLEIAKSVESDITKFYSEQTAVRQATLDAFATSSIARLRAIGAEAQSALSALNAIQSNQSRAATGPGKALGGFTVGGEMVHAGEWVMPAWMVNAFGGLVGQLEGVRTGSAAASRTINNNVSINAKLDSTLDFRAIGRELSWELGRT